jgi:hypothetical protein
MWTLDFRTTDVGGPVATTSKLYDGHARRGDGLAALPPNPAGVTFVVHGFNKDRKDGRAQVDAFARTAVELVPAIAPTTFVGVLWPGDAVIGFLSYPTEEADADRTAERFAAVLAAARLSPSPNFVAHSLGARVVLATVDRLARDLPGRAWADQIVLLAAAVDDDVLGRNDRYAKGAASASRLLTVASTADGVLRYAFPAGDWIAGLFSGGYTRRALGRFGPASSPSPPPATRRFQVGNLGVEHGDYLGDKDKQRWAARFAGCALARMEPLEYKQVP